MIFLQNVLTIVIILCVAGLLIVSVLYLFIEKNEKRKENKKDVDVDE